eukprot:TRINITY_DN5643_c1_g1_i1.p1 TRINITY_DN5643_c1_g1~~TRINITY_DN5643_c1_g1_i1.p1  ORF type:complete len:705 (+),score=77.47 TRINITY_DN5643_c1_g1_i1:70-2184(+)
MAAPALPEVAYSLVRKLIHNGVPAARIRARIEKVHKEFSKDTTGHALTVPAHDPHVQLVNEAFTELRYRSLLGCMRKDMPLFPKQSGDEDEYWPTGTAKPVVPGVSTAEASALVRTNPQRVSFPLPQLVKPPGSEEPQQDTALNELAPARRGRLQTVYRWLQSQSSERRYARPVLMPRRIETTSRGKDPDPGNLLTDALVAPARETGRPVAYLSPLEARCVASRLLRQASEMLSAAGDPAAAHTAAVRAFQGVSYAIELFREAHGITDGSDHPLLVPALNVRAFCALQGGDLPGCQEDLNRLKALLLGMNCTDDVCVYPMDPLRFQPRREKAIMLATLTRYALQKDDLECVVESAQEALSLFDADERNTGGATLSLIKAHALARLGRTEEAEEVFKSTLQEVVEQYSRHSPLIVPHLEMMATFALEQKNFSDATVLASTAYQNLYVNYGGLHPRTMYQMQQVAEVYLRTKNYAVATTWLKVLHRLCIEHIQRFGRPPARLRYAKALHLLSLAHLGLRRTRAALQFSTRSLYMHERVLPADSPLMREPLLAWVTAFRMTSGYVYPDLQQLAIIRLNRAFSLTLNLEREIGATADACYILTQLCIVKLWIGDTGEGVACWAELSKRLYGLQEADRTILADDVSVIISALACHAPDTAAALGLLSVRGGFTGVVVTSICGFVVGWSALCTVSVLQAQWLQYEATFVQ